MIERVILAKPRGFCAGVARSINVVEECLRIFGAPVYVKHAIVHNKTVVADLEGKGAVTVESVEEIPEGSVAVFSAHGSPPDDFEKARERNLTLIDATCPLVTKVHIEIMRFIRGGFDIVYVGHREHIEGKGVIGEAKKRGVNVPLIDSIADVEKLSLGEGARVAILTQTTLSVDETREIIAEIKKKYPQAIEPPAKDICYATTNRQLAIKELAKKAEVIFVVGSCTSSNSNRLVQVAKKAGTPAWLIDDQKEIKDEWLEGKKVVGLSAGASAPEKKVQEIVEYFAKKGAKIEELETVKEKMTFTEPQELVKVKKEHLTKD